MQETDYLQKHIDFLGEEGVALINTFLPLIMDPFGKCTFYLERFLYWSWLPDAFLWFRAHYFPAFRLLSLAFSDYKLQKNLLEFNTFFFREVCEHNLSI